MMDNDANFIEDQQKNKTTFWEGNSDCEDKVEFKLAIKVKKAK